MTPIGEIHLWFAEAALVAGAVIAVARKGTPFHRWAGRVYVASMVGVVVTAFMIYRLFGGFGVFHVAAIVSGLTLIGGFVPVILKRPRGTWVYLHLNFMAYSYLGLLAAAASEAAVRTPMVPALARMLGTSIGMSFGIAVGVPTTLVFIIGSRLIKRRGGRAAELLIQRYL